MDDIIDLLKIKIEKAKANLPEETQNAIAAVDWKTAILELRTKYGYSFEQLGDLEIETELVLCGLVSAKDYPKEVAARMQISRAAANEVVNEMNESVFKKIKEELIKNTERKKNFQKSLQSSIPLVKKPSPAPIPIPTEGEKEILSKAGIEIVPAHTLAGGDVKRDIHPMLTQKLSTSVQLPTTTTEHTLENLTKATNPSEEAVKNVSKTVDPYREIPE